MSFNFGSVSQHESLGCLFDPQPFVRGLFNPGFNIQQNDDSTLSTVGSSQLEVPTEFQSTNDDSQVAFACRSTTVGSIGLTKVCMGICNGL
jgi:hypothetical protein